MFRIYAPDATRPGPFTTGSSSYVPFFAHMRSLCRLAKETGPSSPKKVVSCYRPDEVRALLNAADQDEREIVAFFLATGGRKQKVQFAAWSDIDWIAKTLTVREKLDLGFRPKDREEGSIPLPDFLLVILRERRSRYPRTRFVFELTSGKTEDHFLRVVKRLALRAELNCGDCWSKAGKCCATHPVCKRIVLHKLRKLTPPCTMSQACQQERFSVGCVTPIWRRL